MISALRADGIGAQEATILWHTDEKTRSIVQYGTTPAYGSEAEVSTLLFEHTVTLGGLTPSTTYHFRAHGTDDAGNETVSDDAVFTTSAEGEPEVIIDDGDPDMTFFGAWNFGSSAGGYDDDYRWTTDQPSVSP